MANHTGSSGVVKIGTNTVAEVRSFTINTTAELLEDTTLTDTSKTYQVGKKGATVSVECFWDETDTNGQIALAEGSSVALDLFPEGTDSSDYYAEADREFIVQARAAIKQGYTVVYSSWW